MLFNFIGCPQSGKTTTAAMLFASLKETSVVAEFCSEQARLYIARKRITLGLRPEDRLELDDEDQLQIMKNQMETEEILVKSCGDKVMIISDSSPLNSLLYMTPEFRVRPEVRRLANRAMLLKPLSFYCHPIYKPYLQDPNRIHSEVESRAIDQLIPEMLKAFPELQVQGVSGTVSERLLLVQNRIFFP